MKTIMITEINGEYNLDLWRYSEWDDIVLWNTEFEVIKIEWQKAKLKLINK